MLEHGGRLSAAMARFGGVPAQWVDLSTGVNPYPYPVPAIDPGCWQHLPDDDTALHAAAAAYYGSAELLAVAGSQAAIQALPALVGGERVGLLAPSYAEHAHAWRHHRPERFTVDRLDAAVARLDTLVLVNPNNPTGERLSTEQLLDWHTRLGRRGGTLVVDEAFADTDPADSLAAHVGVPGLVVLRSLGKFFGLAGARVGFILAEPALRTRLAEHLGPWTVAGPAQAVATAALADTAWQQAMRPRLVTAAAQLRAVLEGHGARPRGSSPLFHWIPCAQARAWQTHLAQAALWVRAFDTPPALRFGLPPDAAALARLDAALAAGRAAGLCLT